MAFYVLMLAVSVVVGVLSWRRSQGRMTHYLTYTGAPLVWVLLGAASVVSIVAELADPGSELATSLFTGGLIGTAFVMVVLLRHTASQLDRQAQEQKEQTVEREQVAERQRAQRQQQVAELERLRAEEQQP